MPARIVSKILYDEETGIPFFEDIHGNLHMAGNWTQSIPLPATRHYIQTISHLKFPDTLWFHSIPNKLTGESTTEYTIPARHEWHPAFIMASQDLLGKKKEPIGMSIIGFYLNDMLTMVIPFMNDMHYVLYEPLNFPANTKMEFKLMPCSKDTRICIICGGELRRS